MFSYSSQLTCLSSADLPGDILVMIIFFQQRDVNASICRLFILVWPVLQTFHLKQEIHESMRKTEYQVYFIIETEQECGREFN